MVQARAFHPVAAPRSLGAREGRELINCCSYNLIHFSGPFGIQE
jgi:hypothetical protein